MSMSDFSQHVPLSTFLQAHPDQGSLRVQVASGGGTAVKQTAMERMRQQTHEAVRPR